MSVVARWFASIGPGNDEEGQGLAEYALILALIAIVAILALIFLGDTINDLMDLIGNTIDQCSSDPSDPACTNP